MYKHLYAHQMTTLRTMRHDLVTALTECRDESERFPNDKVLDERFVELVELILQITKEIDAREATL